jgi:hypothetical protein
MLPPSFAQLPFDPSTTWLAVVVGTSVTGLVFVALRYRTPRLGRLALISREQDLSWDKLLELLQARERALAASGAPPDQDLPPDDAIAMWLALLPLKSARRPPEISPEERQFLEDGGVDQRSSRRRWGNPTEVYLSAPLVGDRRHGIVINRSTGGLGIFVDERIEPGMQVQVRASEAPAYVPWAEVEVKFCRRIRGQFLIGCQFRTEIPWNVRVWFG